MSYRETEIVQWGIERNLIGPTGEATRNGQWRKTIEEVMELLEAIDENDPEKAKDALGDVYVTLVMQAKMWGLTMDECIEAAWQQIRHRKGRMINGVFVKEESEASPTKETSCWRCSEPYSETLDRCPNCKATNANASLGAALAEMSQDRQDAERRDNT